MRKNKESKQLWLKILLEPRVLGQRDAAERCSCVQTCWTPWLWSVRGEAWDQGNGDREHRRGQEMAPLGNIDWIGGRWHRKTSMCYRNRERTRRGEWFSNKGVANTAGWPGDRETKCVRMLQSLMAVRWALLASDRGTVETHLPTRVPSAYSVNSILVLSDIKATALNQLWQKDF